MNEHDLMEKRIDEVNNKLMLILKEHGVGLFEFFKDEVQFNHWVLRLDKSDLDSPSYTKMKKEVSKWALESLHPGFTLVFETIKSPVQLPLPGLDPVAHPSHYNFGKIEVIEAIEDWNLNFTRGNAIKYLVRAGRKSPDKEIEDLEKAKWYIGREIETLKAKKENRIPVKPDEMKK